MAKGNRVFTDSQESLIKDVVNRIVPAEGEFPGAGDLGVASHFDAAVGQSARLTKLFLTGLSHIEVVALRSQGKDFGALSPEERDQVLRQVERDQPEFFNALVQHTYNGYYTNPAVFLPYRLRGTSSSAPGLPHEALRPQAPGKRQKARTAVPTSLVGRKQANRQQKRGPWALF